MNLEERIKRRGRLVTGRDYTPGGTNHTLLINIQIFPKKNAIFLPYNHEHSKRALAWVEYWGVV